jgi:hypothetical protein
MGEFARHVHPVLDRPVIVPSPGRRRLDLFRGVDGLIAERGGLIRVFAHGVFHRHFLEDTVQRRRPGCVPLTAMYACVESRARNHPGNELVDPMPKMSTT